MSRNLIAAIVVIVVVPVVALLVLRDPGAPIGAQASKLVILSGENSHEFNVELALTPEERSKGLMFRREMAADNGMLFDFGRDYGRASMWMKNTYIPLDMLFIKEDGTIESIAERTVPESLEAVNSRGPVRGVLELNGGTTSRLGIKPGDRVLHPVFGSAE